MPFPFSTAFLWILAALAGPAAGDADPAGAWQGTVAIDSMKLRVGFELQRGEDGAWTAQMSSIDQGQGAIPVETVVIEGASVRFEAHSIGVEVAGTLAAGGQRIDATFRQGSIDLPLVLERVPKLAVPERTQTPEPPFPYREEEVEYDSANEDVLLGGTLTIPEGAGPFPAVVLVTGSGPQDRDESLLGHKPFLVIADYLARRGIAVLRADDRGVGRSTGRFDVATTFDFCDDALGGVALLKTRAEIDPLRIGIAGHSEGGLVAPIAATRSSDVAFIVLLAGPGVPGKDILLEQIRLISLANGRAAQHVDAEVALNSALISLVEGAEVGPELGKQLKTVFDGAKQAAPLEQGWIFEETEKMLSELNTPWFKAFLSLEPGAVLEQVACPVLVLNGAKDLQVPAGQNVAAIVDALARGGNERVSSKVYPDLNHLFQPCATGAPSEYAASPITFAKEALADIVEFVRAQ